MSENTLVTIEAVKRTETGKSYTRKLRQKGMIPANLMDGGKSTMLELNPKLLSKAWKSTKTFNLTLEGKTKTVKIHELQINVVNRQALHVDLMYV